MFSNRNILNLDSFESYNLIVKSIRNLNLNAGDDQTLETLYEQMYNVKIIKDNNGNWQSLQFNKHHDYTLFFMKF